MASITDSTESTLSSTTEYDLSAKINPAADQHPAIVKAVNDLTDLAMIF